MCIEMFTHFVTRRRLCSVLQCVAVCCSVLQCVAVCCSVLQCVAECVSRCWRTLLHVQGCIHTRRMCVKKLTHFVKAKGSINNRMMCVNTLTHIVTRQRLHTHPEDVCQRCCAGFVLCYKLTAAHTLRPLLHERERPTPHTPSALCYTSTSRNKGVYVFTPFDKDQGCLHIYTYTHIHIYTYTYTHIHIYTYTHIPRVSTRIPRVYMCIRPS